MNIINIFELDENAGVLDKKELENNSKISIEKPSEEFIKNAENNFDISGEWLVIDNVLEIDNNCLTYFKNEDRKITWIKLPEKYVEDNYMINYDPDNECPIGVDVLIRENGYPVGVISHCNCVNQTNVVNNLDGHEYKGELGISLNQDYFLTCKKECTEFKLVKTNIDWDRGKRTI